MSLYNSDVAHETFLAYQRITNWFRTNNEIPNMTLDRIIEVGMELTKNFWDVDFPEEGPVMIEALRVIRKRLIHNHISAQIKMYIDRKEV